MTEWEVVLAEMKAQLYMHCGTLVIRLAKEVNFMVLKNLHNYCKEPVLS